MSSQNFVARPGSQFVQSGTGAVERTVGNKLSEFPSVKDFGAVGDGLTNDAAAIQAAINAAEGQTLYFPEGSYLTGSTTLSLKGDSRYVFASTSAIIKYTGSGAALFIDRKKNIDIISGGIDLSGAGTNAIGLKATGVWFLTYYAPEIIQGPSNSVGIYLEPYTGWGGTYIIKIIGADFFAGAGRAAIETNGDITHLQIEGGWVKSKNVGIILNGDSNTRVRDTVIESCTTYGLSAQSTSSLKIETAEISGCPSGQFNFLSGNVETYLLMPSLVGNSYDLTSYKPTTLDRSRLILKGSNSIGNDYYTQYEAIYTYAKSLSLKHKGGGGEFEFLSAGDNTRLNFGWPNGINLQRNGITYCVVDQNLVRPDTDNAVSLGNSSYKWSSVWAANGTIQTSDERTKTEISDCKLGLDFVNALRPVSYKWIEGSREVEVERWEDVEILSEDGKDTYIDKQPVIRETSKPGARTHWGLIAQDVKQAVDAAGIDFGGWVLTDKDDLNSQQALRYDQFIAPLIKAVQELSDEVKKLQHRLDSLNTL